ncbi:hypothetical protein CJF32_00011351 [Rutstroemia sp. NJR-2017a WRK4]|nr:hypothetical protein CJF32_00011351 [Rutstroemia sp. NJR-2017a WRK4]
MLELVNIYNKISQIEGIITKTLADWDLFSDYLVKNSNNLAILANSLPDFTR